MSKTTDNLIAELEAQNHKIDSGKGRDYQFVCFGNWVEVFGKKAIVTGFEKFGDGMNAKCYYEEGGFDWINRDELENEMEKINGIIN